MKEDEVLRQCLTYLEMKGIYCWRNNTGATKIGNRFIRYGYKGSSDILGILPNGRFLAVECKREKGGILSPAQKIFLENINKNGGLGIVVNSVEKLKENLKNI